jgi:hypothetical protein
VTARCGRETAELLSALDLAIECLGVANFVEQSAAYVVGPLVGAILAVGAAFILRGRGGGASGSRAAQGALATEVVHPDEGGPTHS